MGSSRTNVMLAKVWSGEKNINAAFLHLKTVSQNVSLEAELLGLMSVP